MTSENVHFSSLRRFTRLLYLEKSVSINYIWNRMNNMTGAFISAPTLGSGNLKDVVRLPMGENVDEWMAVNSEGFFQDLFLILLWSF